MAISNVPTGVMNLEDGPLDVIVSPTIAGYRYEVGDVILICGPGGTEGDDLDACIAVQDISGEVEATLQADISTNFLGISYGYISELNTVDGNELPIATRGRVRLNCTDTSALPLGQLMAVRCELVGSVYVPTARTVEATALSTKAIGRLVQRKEAADTTVLVEFRSVVTTGAIS
jgi:hypothetical protein